MRWPSSTRIPLLLAATAGLGQDRAPAWVKVTDKAPWQPRDSSGEAVFNGRLWLLGGWFDSYSAPPRDVWSSADGRAWTRVTAEAPWKYGDLPMALAFRDRLWVLGGWSNNPARNWGDVWHSRDGRAWQRLPSEPMWTARHEHSAYVFQDRIWVAGGHAQPLSSDVWSLEVPEGWFKD